MLTITSTMLYYIFILPPTTASFDWLPLSAFPSRCEPGLIILPYSIGSEYGTRL